MYLHGLNKKSMSISLFVIASDVRAGDMIGSSLVSDIKCTND